jgi:hypothetical protein
MATIIKFLFILFPILNLHHTIISNNNNFYKKLNLNKKFLQQNTNLKFKILLNPQTSSSSNELIFDHYILESCTTLNNNNNTLQESTNDYLNDKLKINLIYRTRYEFNFELSFSVNAVNSFMILDKTFKLKFSFITKTPEKQQQQQDYYYIIDIISNDLIYKLSLLPSIKSNDLGNTTNPNTDESDDDDLIYYYFDAYIDRYANRNQLLLSKPILDIELSDINALTMDLNQFHQILELSKFLFNGNFNETNIFNRTLLSDYTIGCIDPVYEDSDTRSLMFGEDDHDDRHLCKSNLFNLLIINDLNHLKIQLNKNFNDFKFKYDYLNLILYIRKTDDTNNKLETPNIVYINLRINLMFDKMLNLNLMNYIHAINSQNDSRVKRQQLTSDDDNSLFESNVGVGVGHKSQNFYSNILSPLQLVINEDTIGLQTKVKLYDYIWYEYQLNASDYVKERIQLLSPDNSMLNITKRFDYETGGSLHSFQIVFLRKLDKRTSKFNYTLYKNMFNFSGNFSP